ncbi:hypothetical protein NA56DRAFT_587732, partial [Hyaloscypha hepaticicola]
LDTRYNTSWYIEPIIVSKYQFYSRRKTLITEIRYLIIAGRVLADIKAYNRVVL